MARSRRFSVALVVGIALVALAVPAGADIVLSLTVSPGHGTPGSALEVSGTDCVTFDAREGMAALLDSDGGAIDVGSATPAPSGEWTVDLTTEGDTRPGTYDVVANCSGYDSYIGEAGRFDYGESSYTVDFPTTMPTATGTLTLDEDSARPGDTVTVDGVADPGDDVNVALYSSPVLLTNTAVTADADGKFSAPVTIPTGTATGAHTLVAMNTEGRSAPVVLTAPITVGGAAAPAGTPGATGNLAATGASGTRPLVLSGLAFMAAGAGIVLASRRRTPVEV